MDKWDSRFIEMAKLVSTWSSCIRHKVGCAIVRDKRILTTGYNGAPAGVNTCKDKEICIRDTLKIESGTKQELCYAVHAEQNAIVQAAKLGLSLEGATLYCTHRPCSICAKLIINSGIKRVVYLFEYPDNFAQDLLLAAGVKIEKMEEFV
jgi:dCMP deaminase